MLEPKQGSPLHHFSTTFHGIRFVLLGFDPNKRFQVLSKLVDGGGVDVGLYSPNCTHVIVDKLLYDDPVCVAARSDGKILVTSLWVDHSFDVGMPVDYTNIMYRPLKDLKGIPGAKSLNICLTGYQRQDREDIMIMVDLMGASFSKPLIATKVTHLICYKFEGEKYELAKKLQKIKLVNHRWLEDCLKAWEILPEANYDKSTYELELAEAEAKDSEEETEDVATKKCGDEATIPARQNQTTKVEVSRNLSDSNASKGLLNVENTVDNSSLTGKQTSVQLPNFNKLINQHHDVTLGEKAKQYDTTETPLRVENGSVSISSTSAKKSPHSDTKKSGLIGYMRKTLKRTSPILSGDMSSNLRRSSSPMTNMTECNLSDHIYPFRTKQANTGSSFSEFKTPLKGTDVLPEEGQSGKLPEKRKIDVSSGNLKSQNTKGLNTEALTSKVSTVANRRSGVFESASKIDVHAPTSRTTLSPSAIPSFEDVEKEFENCFLASENDKLTNKSDKPDACMSNAKDGIGEACEPENKIASIGVSSPTSLKSYTEKSNSSPTVDLVKRGSADKNSKPVRSKMLAKKFFGSKKRSGKGSSASQKGSIYLNKDISHNDTVTYSETTEYHSANSEKPETKDAQQSGNEADNKSEFMDDETEAPVEDKAENEVEVVGEKRAQIEPEDKSDDVQHLTDSKDEHQMEIDDDINRSEQRSAVSGKKSEVGESGHVDNASKVKKTKGTKDAQQSGNEADNKSEFMDDETEAPEEDNVENEPGVAVVGEKHAQIEPEEKSEDVPLVTENKDEHQMEIDDNMDKSEQKTAVRGDKSEVGEPGHVDNASKRRSGKTKKKIAPSITKETNSNEAANKDVIISERKNENIQGRKKESNTPDLTAKRKGRKSANKMHNTSELGKENMPIELRGSKGAEKVGSSKIESKRVESVLKKDSDPVWFILTGHKLQQKEYQQVITRLKGRVCRVSHQWSYKATHFIVPDPIRRTEKFFAAAASGRWILKTDYLSDSNKAGRFLGEEAYEWHKNSLSEDGAINLEAPRKWRLLRERTGHGAFYGMRIIIYGDCIAPSLDTLKRVIKAGGGTILATSPPYSRFLECEVDFAIVSPGMAHVDMWVQDFIRHEIPCVVADYLVEYVCKPGYSLERYVQYNTHAWAQKSLKNLVNRLEEEKENDDVEDLVRSPEQEGGDRGSDEDIACRVCGSQERGEVMLICGDESGLTGCGVGTHIDCCDPPLESVPDQDWFCPNCTTTTTVAKNIKNPPKRPRKTTPVSRRK